MANTYSYNGPGERWAEDDPTAEDYLNVARENCDYLHEALGTIMDMDAADGALSLTGNITMADDTWIGLGAAKGRIVFDDTPATDALSFMSCKVGVGVAPDALLTLSGALGTGAEEAMSFYNTTAAADGNEIQSDFWFKSVAWTNTLGAQISIVADSYYGRGDFVYRAHDTGGASSLTERFRIYASGAGIAIPATAKLYLDGGGDTYISEVAANVINFVSLGAEGFYFNGNQVNWGYNTNANDGINFNYAGYQSGATQFRDLSIFNGKGAAMSVWDGSANTITHTAHTYQTTSNIYMTQGYVIYLDTDADTGIYAAADDQIYFQLAGATHATMTNGWFQVGAGVAFTIAVGQKFYLDGGGDTYIAETSANIMRMYTGGVNTLTLWATGAQVYTPFYVGGNVIYLDADNDTYISAATDDEIAFYCASAIKGKVTSLGLQMGANIYLSGSYIYLDADSDTYIDGGTTDDVIIFWTAGAANTYMRTNEINGNWAHAADNGAIYINNNGYLGGDSYFRDTYIRNGKAATLSFWDGSAGTLTHSCEVIVGTSGWGTGALQVVNNDATATILNIYNIKGSAGTKSQILFGNFDGTFTTSSAASIYSDVVSGTYGRLVFQTYNGGITTDMTISAGVINIPGLTASQDVQTDGSKNLVSVSDARWKNDLGLVDNALEKVRQLKPRVFTWKRSATESFSDSHQAAQPRLAGFFAQEVYSIFPEGSPGGANTDSFGMDHWGLNSRSLIALNTAAIQEVDSKVDSEVQQLRKRVEYLEAKLAA